MVAEVGIKVDAMIDRGRVEVAVETVTEKTVEIATGDEMTIGQDQTTAIDPAATTEIETEAARAHAPAHLLPVVDALQATTMTMAAILHHSTAQEGQDLEAGPELRRGDERVVAYHVVGARKTSEGIGCSDSDVEYPKRT